MRRLLNMAFTVVYLALTVGLTVIVHFCGTDLASVRLAPLTSSRTSCCCGDDEQERPCCNTQKLTVQLSDEHLTPAPQDHAPQSHGTPFLFTAQRERGLDRPQAVASLIPVSPGGPSRTILHCTFLI